MAEFTLRTARPADAAAISRVHVLGWQVGYRGIVPDAVLDALSVEQRAGDWATRLAGAGVSSGVSSTAVAETGGAIVGFATLVAPSVDEDAGPAACELAALYVDPDHWRRGIGRALVHESIALARAGGWHELTAWVLAENAPARSFYETLGFAPDGAERDHERGGETVIRLRAPLAGRARPGPSRARG